MIGLGSDSLPKVIHIKNEFYSHLCANIKINLGPKTITFPWLNGINTTLCFRKELVFDLGWLLADQPRGTRKHFPLMRAWSDRVRSFQDERTGEMKKTAECRTEHKDPLEKQMELCRIPRYPLNATRALTSGSSLPVR